MKKTRPLLPRSLDATILGIFNEVRSNQTGEIATYIPELARANPESFGLCLAMADGELYRAGESSLPFTIQSISKPFVYAMALQQFGHEEVRRCVGVEPSGEAFNSISLEPVSGRPLNPMINAGSIAISSMIYKGFGEDSLRSLLDFIGNFTGREMMVDQKVFESERDTGHRNRAIAHLLRNFGILGDPVEKGLELYFQQCSILVTAEDLAMMGATLANRGVNPRTGKQAISLGLVDDMLSVMATCGMYDCAGEWLYDVGLPAKSGVSGGILAVLPGRMGIGVYSPRLDSHGNSVRGSLVCKRLSEQFRLHLFSSSRPCRSVIRRRHTLRDRKSMRARSMREAAILKRLGHSALLFELQGDVQFTGMEAVQREVAEASESATHVVLDFTRVDSMDHVAVGGLVNLVLSLLEHGVHVAISGAVHVRLRELPLPIGTGPVAYFDDLPSALEACEESLISGNLMRETHVASGPAAHEPLELTQWINETEFAALQKYMVRRRFLAGEQICVKGEAANDIFFLERGMVSARIPLPDGAWKLLARLGSGTVFGEMAVIDRGVRSSDIWAETDASCLTLSLEMYDEMTHTNPVLKTRILEYLLVVLTARLRGANDQIATLMV